MTDKSKLTNRQIRGRVEKSTKEFMTAARKFLATKAGGNEVPPEWEISLLMLETYYKEFLELTYRIDELDSLTIVGRYGEVANPILGVRDKACARLESLLKQMGMTMKSGINLGVTDAKPEESVLDKYMKSKIEKR